jgi:hypothetical protein
MPAKKYTNAACFFNLGFLPHHSPSSNANLCSSQERMQDGEAVVVVWEET